MADSIKITSPTRIDLAGGTLDLWPIYCLLGQTYTINFAIDIYTQVNLKKHTNQQIDLHITNLKYHKSFPSLQHFLTSTNPEIQMIQRVVAHFQPLYGFELTTSSMSPVGGGLGGSSSLLISLLEAFEQTLDQRQDVLSRINLAHNIEASFLGQPTGTQDYFAPILKTGTFLISYNWKGIHYQHLKTPSIIKEKCLLIDTGRPHHSGWNNWQVLKDFINGDTKTKIALQKIAKVAQEMYFMFSQNDRLEDLSHLFDEEFTARISLNKAFSSPEIEALRQDLPAHSALKICGAGGGGCVMVWTKEKEQVRKLCHQKGYHILNAHPL